MTRAAQKDEEIFYAGEFLRNQLKLHVAELKPAVQEPPDCSAAVTNEGGITTLVDLELTKYHVDDPTEGKGGSTAERASSWWDKVCAALYLHPEKLKLPVEVAVRFKEPVSLKNQQVSSFADELIRFAREFCPKRHLEPITFEVFAPESYSLLNEHVEEIALKHIEGAAGIGLHYSNPPASIGLRRSHLAQLVRGKSTRPFTWRPGAEKWLLVYAPGGTVTSRAGPPPPDKSIWDDEELVAACHRSVFDRIYFWERVRTWHKRLK